MSGLNRPALCALCKCPAADGGVRVDSLDADKLSEWIRRTMQSELDPHDVKKFDVICQFCMWQAKLEYEYPDKASVLGGACDWWTGHATNHHFHQYFFLNDVMQPCKVVLEHLDTRPGAITKRPAEVAVSKRGRPGKPSKCVHCPALFTSQSAALRHMESKHQDVRSRPKILQQPLKVSNAYGNLQRGQHQAKEDSKIFKCTECSYRASHKRTLDHHVDARHGRRRLQCPKCTKVYRSEVSLRIHLKQGHSKWLPCDHCGSILMDVHRHARIKKCPKCDFVAACNTLMAQHVRKCKTAVTFRSED